MILFNRLMYHLRQDYQRNPGLVIGATLFYVSCLVFAGVGIWAAFYHLPVWAATLTVAGVLGVVGYKIAEEFDGY